MEELDKLRKQLVQARADDRRRAAESLAERERLLGLERKSSTLSRHFDEKNREHRARRRELEQSIAESRQRSDQLKLRSKDARLNLGRLHELVATLVDPRKATAKLDANIPILLFPVRLETRFVAASPDAAQERELLVRIYPDDCLIESFEPELSEGEVKNLRRYWCGVHRAGGNVELERAAWRELSASHGAGRSVYLVQQYQPLAESDPHFIRTALSEVALVIPVDPGQVAAGEKAPIASYWTERFRANDERAGFDDLVGSLGAARAQEVVTSIVPFNHREQPAAGVDRAGVPLRVLFVVMDAVESVAVKARSWTRAPEVSLLPERFVLLGDSGREHLEQLGRPVKQPLAVGPDPLAEQSDQFAPDGSELSVPEPLQWMTDFDAALDTGMAFRVPLTERQAEFGFDRLYVIGVRLGSDEATSQQELQDLLSAHARSQNGLSLLKQGTPTNNSEQSSAGWRRVQEADELFDLARGLTDGRSFDPEATEAYARSDGLILAEALGIDPSVLQQIPNAAATDHAEARAMNAALWPATLGYWMNTQLRPVFDDDDIGRMRRYFIERVTGRGSLPALRIGKQPYGVLSTAAVSRLSWFDDKAQAGVSLAVPREDQRFLHVLYGVLRRLESSFFGRLTAEVPRVGDGRGDRQRALLAILGLHPASVDFHLDVFDSADRLWNTGRFRILSSVLEASMRAEMQAGIDLIRSFGHDGADPEIVEKFFSRVQGPLDRPTVDVLPPSEEAPLSSVTDAGLNYIGWCRDKARSAFDELRREVGFSDNKKPNSLLFRMLRHALEQSYHDTAIGLHVQYALLNSARLLEAYREPPFIHIVKGQGIAQSESRYRWLYNPAPAITGSQETLVHDHIPSWLATDGADSVLADQLKALAVLEQLPTARLQRAFAEHIDLCSYRFDAWMMSFVNERLQRLRRPEGADGEARRGIYLGAFGWVHDLRPKPARTEGPTLSRELSSIFERPGDAPLERSPDNGGHMLTPSLNHATTAAVLRSGYLSNADSSDPDLFAIDLSSRRVRIALSFIEGIAAGQPLGALLGYRIERALHDRQPAVEVDALIYELRRGFPLVANHNPESVDEAAERAAIQAIEARNVCDGLRLINHVRQSAEPNYPWGKDLVRGTALQEDAINQEVRALFEIHDAISDVALAESVHQTTMGNPDRAAASLKAFSKGEFPPQPDVVRTPRSGTVLTHRVALQLPPPASPAATATPRAQVEPGLDQWLGQQLPSLEDLVVQVSFKNTPDAAAPGSTHVGMQSLGWSPYDLLFVLDTTNESAMNELDDRILAHVLSSEGLCPDASIQIEHTEPVSGKVTVFEAMPLLVALRSLLLSARPLSPSDVALTGEAQGSADGSLSIPNARPAAARSAVASLLSDLDTRATALAPLVQTGTSMATLVGAIDSELSEYLNLTQRAALCGVSLSSPGGVLDALAECFSTVRAEARRVADFFQSKIDECGAQLAIANDTSKSNHERLEAVQRAERAVSTTYTTALPSTPDPMVLAVTAKRTAMNSVRSQVVAVAESSATTVQALWTAWQATFAPRRSHDVTVIEIEAHQQALRALLSTMAQQVSGLKKELAQRLSKADALLTELAPVGGARRVELQQAAVKALLGDGFRMVPRFTLASEQADEWQNAFDGRVAALSHAASLHEFPVDDWLYGLARVRPKLHDLEKVIQLSNALSLPEPELSPVQFPFVAAEPWLGLELPEGFNPANTGEHLLYTAIYPAGGFDRGATSQGGLLLDEWTEVIPSTQETAGLAFHYDRPDNEPPQTLLLVTPAGTGEAWSWTDLRQAVLDTFELAQQRAVEPSQIFATPLARLLPATLMSFTTRATSPSSRLWAADLLFNNEGLER